MAELRTEFAELRAELRTELRGGLAGLEAGLLARIGMAEGALRAFGEPGHDSQREEQRPGRRRGGGGAEAHGKRRIAEPSDPHGALGAHAVAPATPDEARG